MKKMFAIIGALALTTALVAQDVPAGPQLTWYGSAQYRLRYELKSWDTTGTSKSSNNYINTVGYKLGLKVAVNQQLKMQFELGNYWFKTDNVTQPMALAPMMSVAMADWNPGAFHVACGLMPFKGSSMMDLFGAKQFSGSYKAASWTPWGVYTNFAMPGLKVGAPILKGDMKLSVDLSTTVLKEPAVTEAVDTMYVNNPSTVMLLLDVPFSVGKLTVSPQAYMAFNRFFKDDVKGGFFQDQSDNELGAGIDATFGVNDMISVRGGFGLSMNDSINTVDSAANAVKREYSGMEFGVGASVKAGPGKADIDFVYSIHDDAADTNKAAVSYPFVDVKYSYAANKNFSIMPRLRLFMWSDEHDRSFMNVRPEMIFTGSF